VGATVIGIVVGIVVAIRIGEVAAGAEAVEVEAGMFTIRGECH
jgi:hypothetical protein